MTSYPPEPEYPGYSPPPPTDTPAPNPYTPAGYPPPASPPAGYPPAGYPPAGYPPPDGGHYNPAYPPQQYGSAYGYQQQLPPASRGSGRPGTVTAAAVLAYVTAGLLIIAGIFLLAGASAVSDISDAADLDTSDGTTELALDGLVNLVAAGLLIAGGVLFAGQKRNGQFMLFGGSAITVVASIYWASRFGSVLVFWALLYAALVIITSCLALGGAARQWLAGRPT